MNTLDGKVAIVTGSARGIGLATAERFAQKGARIVLNSVDAGPLEGIASRMNGRAVPLAGDITDSEVPDALVARAMEEWGQLDIVVNNAGYSWDSPLKSMTDEQFHAMLDIHVVAPFRLLRAAAPFLLGPAKAEREHGEERFRKVVNVSSISGTMGNPDQANYNAGKAAIVGLTKGLAKEWGEWKINVNAVAPGFITTRLTADKDDGETIERGGRRIPLGIPEDHRAKGTELVPLGRPGTPAEVADTVLFLSGPQSNYVHGQVISVTGGITLGMTA